MQGYGSAPPRIGKSKGQPAKQSTGLIGSRLSTPARKDSSRVTVKTHTRAKSSRSK